MFSYFKNKILQVEQDSPTKKPSYLTPSEQIYLQQLQNYIDVEGGYQILKKKLTHQINSNYCYDSPFINQISILLRNSYSSTSYDKISRSLDITEDLIAHCGSICNEAFNNDKFCEQLQKLTVFAHIKSKVINKWQFACSRAAGIIFFLAKKYQNQGNSYIFGKYLQHILLQKIQIPEDSSIKEIQFEHQKVENKQNINVIKAADYKKIIEDAAEFVVEAEAKVKKGTVDTTYVRIIKAKSKNLYDLASGKQELNQQEREQVSKIYKRLRTVLKEVEKKNNDNLSKKAVEDEKNYLAKKVESLSGKKEQNLLSPNRRQQVIMSPKKAITPTKVQIIASPSKKQADLLDIDDANQQTEEQNPTNRQVNLKIEDNLLDQPDRYSTPKKSVIKLQSPMKQDSSQKMFDLLNEDDSSGKLDLNKIYEKSSAQKQFQSLDLTGNTPQRLIEQKQKEQVQDFGDFVGTQAEKQQKEINLVESSPERLIRSGQKDKTQNFDDLV